MSTKTGNKGGRPKRSGEKLRRIGATIRPVAFECLDLLARHQRTSVSQVIEQLAITAGMETTVDGGWLLPAADQRANAEPTPRGALQRIVALPPSLRLPDETFVAAVLEKIGGTDEMTEEEAALLGEITGDVKFVGGSVDFAVELWSLGCIALREGKEILSVPDGASGGPLQGLGSTFHYDLNSVRKKASSK